MYVSQHAEVKIHRLRHELQKEKRSNKKQIKCCFAQKSLISIASPNVCNGICSVTNRSDVVINTGGNMFNQQQKIEKNETSHVWKQARLTNPWFVIFHLKEVKCSWVWRFSGSWVREKQNMKVGQKSHFPKVSRPGTLFKGPRAWTCLCLHQGLHHAEFRRSCVIFLGRTWA